MEKIITGDGSETFYNPEFGDVYHSRSGALEESFGKYVKPCQLAETARKNGELRILDVGFGLGYNACAAMHFITKHAPETRLSIVSLEKDPEVLKLLGQVDPKLPEYELIRVLAHQSDHKITKGNQTLELVFGEALQTIAKLPGFFDVIFHDPFSPRKNPELWSIEFFASEFSLLVKGGVLATYSCGKSVRRRLSEAGFRIENGPCLGRVSPSTLAYKD